MSVSDMPAVPNTRPLDDTPQKPFRRFHGAAILAHNTNPGHHICVTQCFQAQMLLHCVFSRETTSQPYAVHRRELSALRVAN